MDSGVSELEYSLDNDNEYLNELSRRDKALDDAIAYYENELDELKQAHDLEVAKLHGQIHALMGRLDRADFDASTCRNPRCNRPSCCGLDCLTSVYHRMEDLEAALVAARCEISTLTSRLNGSTDVGDGRMKSYSREPSQSLPHRPSRRRAPSANDSPYGDRTLPEEDNPNGHAHSPPCDRQTVDPGHLSASLPQPLVQTGPAPQPLPQVSPVQSSPAKIPSIQPVGLEAEALRAMTTAHMDEVRVMSRVLLDAVKSVTATQHAMLGGWGAPDVAQSSTPVGGLHIDDSSTAPYVAPAREVACHSVGMATKPRPHSLPLAAHVPPPIPAAVASKPPLSSCQETSTGAGDLRGAPHQALDGPTGSPLSTDPLAVRHGFPSAPRGPRRPRPAPTNDDQEDSARPRRRTAVQRARDELRALRPEDLPPAGGRVRTRPPGFLGVAAMGGVGGLDPAYEPHMSGSVADPPSIDVAHHLDASAHIRDGAFSVANRAQGLHAQQPAPPSAAPPVQSFIRHPGPHAMAAYPPRAPQPVLRTSLPAEEDPPHHSSGALADIPYAGTAPPPVERHPVDGHDTGILPVVAPPLDVHPRSRPVHDDVYSFQCPDRAAHLPTRETPPASSIAATAFHMSVHPLPPGAAPVSSPPMSTNWMGPADRIHTSPGPTDSASRQGPDTFGRISPSRPSVMEMAASAAQMAVQALSSNAPPAELDSIRSPLENRVARLTSEKNRLEAEVMKGHRRTRSGLARRAAVELELSEVAQALSKERATLRCIDKLTAASARSVSTTKVQLKQ